MKIRFNGLFQEATLTWRCGCKPDAPELPLTASTCPECGKAMPSQIRSRIYAQVKGELQSEIDYEKSLNRGARKRAFRRLLPWLITALVILLVVGLRLLMPELFLPLEQGAADLWQGTLDLPATVGNWFADLWQWICQGWVAAVDFVTSLLSEAGPVGWLGEVLGQAWSWICWLAVLLWDLLLVFLEELPGILSWLWEVLLFVLNQLWILIQFLIEAIPAVFAAVIGLIVALFQALVMVLGLLWEAIEGICSLLF